jgi:glycerol-3-phosphate O-acyltransferase
VHVDASGVAQLKRLAERGTIVYVLRNRSLLDYCLINWLLVARRCRWRASPTA